MKKILLINPPYNRFLSIGIPTYPITFGALGSILKERGYQVGIYDSDFDPALVGRRLGYRDRLLEQHKIPEALHNPDHPVWLEIKRIIHEFHPDIVGITAMTSKFSMATKIAAMTKELFPEAAVLVGGFHATMFAKNILENDRNFDYAMLGEGERTTPELIDAITRNDNCALPEIRGIAFRREDGTVCVTEKRELIADLDELPLVDFSMFLNPGYLPGNNLLTSRGCPFSCTFCGAKAIWTNRVRRRSIEKVVEEIQMLTKHSGSHFVNFWDDSFTANRKYTLELLAALKQIPELTFACITRLDLIDEELLCRMKEAGCVNIFFGIESGNDRMLGIVGKRITTARIEEQIALVRKAQIEWGGFFIMNYPGERRQDIFDMLAFMEKLRPNTAEVNVFSPLPGTPIWDQLVAEGTVSPEMDFSKYSQSSLERCFVEGMTLPELQKLALRVADQFDQYNWRRSGLPFLRRIRLRIGRLRLRSHLAKLFSRQNESKHHDR
ncbi:MAG: radical SAM protein [Victivallaceae bacterium]|nr:radical SAM protein [Victivallaceae bacterium]